MKINNKLIFYIVLLLCSSVFGQIKKDTVSLSELVVTNVPVEKSIQHSAAAVSVLTEKEINQSDGVILTSVLNKIPGVFMQQGTLNTNRIVIRGIGARTQYGTSKVKAYFEGIPLSSTDGETVLEDIDLTALGGVEIIKGPNASSYGSGLGGVISLKAKSVEANVFVGKSGTTFGSFGLNKQSLSTEFNDSRNTFFANYTNLHQDGYRANSNYDRQSLNLFGKLLLSKRSSLALYTIATRLNAFIPSSISETAFHTNPKSAASTWLAAKGFESYDKLQFGLGFDHQFSSYWSLNTTVFSTYKNGYEARPFDILTDKTDGIGFRSKINHKTSLFSLPTVFSIGTEFLTEDYSFSLYRNLYQSYPGKGSVQGNQFIEMEQNRGYWNGFFQMETKLARSLNLESGLAYNTTYYSQQDVFLDAKKNNEKFTFGSVWSPRLVLSYSIDATKNIYISFSKGFSIPTVAESLTANGTINTNLKSEKGVNYEIGFKANFFDKQLYTEVVYYHTPITDLLVARRIAEDQYIGINAGKSTHQGVEFLVNYSLIIDSNIRLNPYLSGTINQFKFTDFVDSGVDYSGNYLPAVPNSQFNFGFDLQTASAFHFVASYQWTDKMFLNDANTKKMNSYQLLDIKASYSLSILKNLKMDWELGVQNLLNEKYASSILPNAVGFGSAPPRYYYPGNPINLYGGFKFIYRFGRT